MTRFLREFSTADSGLPLERSALAGLAPELRLPGRNLTKADVLRYRVSGRRIAIKDYGQRPFLVRHTLGRLLVARECRAYAKAESAPGLVPFLGRLGPFAFATGWIDSTPLAGLEKAAAAPETFDRLDAVIAELHRRGVAIADLHHRDVLITNDGAVFIVDLAAAYLLPPRAGAIRRAVFARLCAQDGVSAARMRARFTGVSEEDALAALDPRTVRLWGTGRRVKAMWNRLRGKRA